MEESIHLILLIIILLNNVVIFICLLHDLYKLHTMTKDSIEMLHKDKRKRWSGKCKEMLSSFEKWLKTDL